jgi:hypothetical protein
LALTLRAASKLNNNIAIKTANIMIKIKAVIVISIMLPPPSQLRIKYLLTSLSQFYVLAA